MIARIARLVAAFAALFAWLGAPAYAAPTGGGPALWSVADEDTTIYLFGTIHALPKGVEWFDGPIADAFAASGELVTEIDPAESASVSGEVAAMAALPKGQTVRQLMTAEDRVQFESALTALRLPVDALDPYEPWYATINLAMLPLLMDGYGPESGVEHVLIGKAAGKKRTALETVQFQIGLFDAMPLNKQLEYLDETVENLPELSTTLDAMVADWLAGDAEGLAILMNDEMTDAEIYDRLLVSRNVQWAEWIENRLDKPGAVFVAVGAGHLAGQGSVQDQLAKRGLTVTRVN